MWLSEDYISQFKERSQFEVHFYKEGTGIFGVEKYRKLFDKLLIERDVQTHYKNKLVKVDGANKRAIFKNFETEELTDVEYDLLHVVPHFKTHDFASKATF